MRFLIDADLPRSTQDLLQRYGHEGIDVRDIGLGASADSEIAQYARNEGFCILTGDFDFSDIRVYPPARYFRIVVLTIPPHATADAILSFIESFLKQTEVIPKIPKSLVIVERDRVRIRK
jgi:predicted nuclease of predicted toxin-antitoxin system